MPDLWIFNFKWLVFTETRGKKKKKTYYRRMKRKKDLLWDLRGEGKNLIMS